jgi:ABC-2 type transport system permease protein
MSAAEFDAAGITSAGIDEDYLDRTSLRAQLGLFYRINLINLKAQTAYRSEFVLGLLFGLVWQGSMVLFAGVLLLRFPGLGGWTQGDVLLIASMRLISHSLYVAFVSNVAQLSLTIQEGRMDGFLLRPMPVYRQVLLSRFQVNSFGDMLAGAGIFALAIYRLDADWTPVKVLYLVCGIAGGALVEAGVQTLLAIFALRFTGMFNWTIWVDQMISTFGNYPLNILPSPVKDALTFAFPVAFIAFLPASVITGRTASTGLPLALTLAAPVLAVGFFLACKAIWYRSLSLYQSIGG